MKNLPFDEFLFKAEEKFAYNAIRSSLIQEEPRTKFNNQQEKVIHNNFMKVWGRTLEKQTITQSQEKSNKKAIERNI